MSEDGREIVVDQVTRQDQGTFSCMAGNPVGAMTAEAKLTVDSSRLGSFDNRLDSNLLQNLVTEASENVDR